MEKQKWITADELGVFELGLSPFEMIELRSAMTVNMKKLRLKPGRRFLSDEIKRLVKKTHPFIHFAFAMRVQDYLHLKDDFAVVLYSMDENEIRILTQDEITEWKPEIDRRMLAMLVDLRNSLRGFSKSSLTPLDKATYDAYSLAADGMLAMMTAGNN